MSEAKISIIIPVYNVEKYIERCVESLLRQTFEDIEIILVNDGSKDNSGHLCDEMSEKDARIKVFHQENQGVSVARNTGISNASADYIVFVDSDDFAAPTMCESLYNIITNTDCDLAVCRAYNTDSEELICYPEEKDLPAPVVLDRDDGVFKMANPLENFCTPWGKIFKKDLVLKCKFPVGVPMAQDLHFVYSYLAYCKKITFTEEKLYYYFAREDSTVHTPITGNKAQKLLFVHSDTVERLSWVDNEKLYHQINAYFSCNCETTILNSLIMNKHSDPDLVKQLQAMLKQNYKSIIKSSLPVMKKIQMLLAALSPALYKYVYAILK
ncbi:MAG: glycosyltransferase [Ruminococcaceae bacterium]|nr:glycosyltransferase [Oscillospiraceae bacterium]